MSRFGRDNPILNWPDGLMVASTRSRNVQGMTSPNLRGEPVEEAFATKLFRAGRSRPDRGVVVIPRCCDAAQTASGILLAVAPRRARPSSSPAHSSG
jgi:hypothetical protein